MTETPLARAFRDTIQNRAFGADDRAAQSCWKLWLQWSGRPIDCNSRALGSEPSDTGLSDTLSGCSHLAVWTRVLGLDLTLRGDCVLLVRWSTRAAAPAMGGRRMFTSASASSRARTSSVMNDEFMLLERPADSKWMLVHRGDPMDGRNSGEPEADGR